MIPIRPATPVGIAPHSERTHFTLLGTCLYCFRVLGSARNRSEQLELEAKHACPEKLQAQQPATPTPFN
jgi:hypothetical protein